MCYSLLLFLFHLLLCFHQGAKTNIQMCTIELTIIRGINLVRYNSLVCSVKCMRIFLFICLKGDEN